MIVGRYPAIGMHKEEGKWQKEKTFLSERTGAGKPDISKVMSCREKLGGYYTTDITSGLIRSFSQELLEEGMASKSVKDILVVLRSILKYAAKQFPGMFPTVEISYL